MRRFFTLLVFASTMAASEPERGVLVEDVATMSDEAQTYTLYLPQEYDPKRKHPLLFVYDPRGRGSLAANIFKDGAEEFGWIVISSNGARSDDDGEPSDRAVRALTGELERYSIDRRRVYAAGFSGTAILAWGVGLRTGALAGVIGVGGRLVDAVPPSKFNFAHYGFAGETDFNNREMRLIDAMLGKSGRVPHRFQAFPGAHQWIPPALAREALQWFEVLATKEDRGAYDEDLEFGAALERTGKLPEALRRYREIVRTFEGIVPVDAARAAVVRLEADAATRAALRDEEKWDAFEAQFVREVVSAVPRIYAVARQEGTVLTASELARQLRVPELKRRARRTGAEGQAARRLLEAIYSQTAFLLPPQLTARKEHAFAAATLGVATDIHSDRWITWYHLGGAHARAGQRKRALDALEQAIGHGFRDAAQVMADEAYAPVREDPRFRSLLSRMHAK